MKASVKLREEEGKPPLLRAKVPVSILSLPFVASFSAGDPHDLALHLLTSFPTSFPSLKLSYHPNPNPNPNPNPSSSSFSLSIRSSLTFPLRFALHLSPSSPNPAFSLRFTPQLGDFSFAKKAHSNPNPNPNPKENGGWVHHPIPVSPPEPRHRTGLEELLAAPMAVRVGTAVPVCPRAGVRVRWAVKLPPEEPAGLDWRARLPYLTVDKISIERVDEQQDEEAAKEEEDRKMWSEKDVAAMGGMCFWIGREVEELRKENAVIKESVESLRNTFSESRRNGVHNAAAGAIAATNAAAGK